MNLQEIEAHSRLEQEIFSAAVEANASRTDTYFITGALMAEQWVLDLADALSQGYQSSPPYC